jgi:hypothetical protein
MAPGDGVAKRPLPGREVPGALPQEVQALISHPLQQGVRREDPQRSSGQLDGQRQPIQPPGQFGERGEVRVGRLVPGMDAPSPLQEQLHSRRDCSVGRYGERPEGIGPLPPGCRGYGGW